MGESWSGTNDEYNRESWERSVEAVSSIMNNQTKENRKSVIMQMGYNTMSAIQQGIYNHIENQAAMSYNSAEAAANRAWQEKMSNTSYQRAMADMEKAGLNPILAYANGGATTPGGAQGSVNGASMGMASSSAAQTSALSPGQQAASNSSYSYNYWHNIADSIQQGMASENHSAQYLNNALNKMVEGGQTSNEGIAMLGGKTSKGNGGGRNK